jgi:hypothetical protein
MNASWTQIAREQGKMFHDDVGTVLACTAYHESRRGSERKASFSAEGLAVGLGVWFKIQLTANEWIYAAEVANAIGSTIEGSSFSGLLTLVEIGHIRIGSAGYGRIKSRGSGSSLSQRA